MARSLSQTLTTLSTLSTTTTTASRWAHFRHRTTDIKLDKPPPPSTEEDNIVAVKKLEDAIHQIIIKKSEPDWLVFVPGGSYWVPPKSTSRGFAQVIGKLVNNPIGFAMVDKDPCLFIDDCSGWPSSANFFKGASDSPLEGEGTSKHAYQSEDEE